MKKMLKLISISLAIVLISLFNVNIVEAAEDKGMYFKDLTVDFLEDGDRIELKNLNINGESYLNWTMGRDYMPHIKLNKNLSSWNVENYFYVHKYDEEYYGLYVISPYDGFKYYISSDFLASKPELKRDIDVKEENRRFMLLKEEGVYRLRFGNNNIPIAMYLTGSLDTEGVTLETFGQASRGKGLNWSIKKSVPIEVDYNKTSSWNNGFTATITITNNTGEDINNWGMDFSYPYEINKNTLANGKIIKSDGYSISISNDGWNSKIANGQSISFNFTGIGNGDINPWNIILRELD